MKETIDDKVLRVLLERDVGYGGCDDWFIASSIYPWDGNRRKHGAWIRVVNQAGLRLKNKGLANGYSLSHGLPGYNAPQSSIWYATEKAHSQSKVGF